MGGVGGGCQTLIEKLADGTTWKFSKKTEFSAFFSIFVVTFSMLFNCFKPIILCYRTWKLTISSLSLSSEIPRRCMCTTNGMYSTIISISATLADVAFNRFCQSARSVLIRYIYISKKNGPIFLFYFKLSKYSTRSYQNHSNEGGVTAIPAKIRLMWLLRMSL